MNEQKVKTVRQNYVKRLRDNYLLILRTLMHDLIVSVDAAGNFVFVNDAAVIFWGKRSKEIVGTHFTKFLHPKDVKKAAAALQELIDGKNMVKSFMLRVNSPRGFRTIAWNGVAVFDDEKNYVGAQATGKDITDILRAQEELKQSKQHFRRLFEVLVDPIVIVDMTGKLLEFSDSAIELLGFSRDELVGKHFLETNLATPESKAVMKKNLASIKKGGYITPHTVEAVTKDGKHLLYELTPTRITYKGEQSILAIFRNITEQKKAEKKLHESEERFRYFIENAPEAIWVQDPTGTFLDGNKRAEEITGYPREDLIGKNILEIDFVPEKYASKVIEAFQTNQRGERSGPTELELKRKDGSLVFVEASSIPVERDGKIDIIGIARDITERKKAEQSLVESEKRFRNTLDNMLEGCQIIDYAWVYVYVNEAAAKHARLTRKQFIGKTMMEAYPKIDETYLFSVLSKCMKDRVPAHLENKFTYSNGETAWFELSIEPVPEGIFVLSIDITDRKEISEALRQQREMLETITANINAGLAVISKDFRILWVNNVLKGHLGEIEGNTCYSVLNRNEKVCNKCGVQEIFETGKSLVVHEQQVPTPAGPIWLEITATAIKDETGQIVAASEMSVDITERKKLETELKASLQKFRTIFEGGTDGILAVNPENYKFIFSNPRMHELTGYPFGALEKLGLADIVPKEGLAFARDQIKQQLEQKITVSRGMPVLRKDKSIVYCDVSSRLMKIGNEEYLIGFFRDVTEQRKAEDALRASEQKYRDLINGMNDTAIVIDFDGKIIDANKTAIEVLGYSREELLSGGPEKFDTALTVEQIEGLVEKLKKTDFLVFETEHTTKNGKSFPVEVSSSRGIYQGKDAIVSIARDITERKKAEDALRASEEKYREILNAMNDTAWVIGFDGKFIDVNNAAVVALGYSKEELLSMGPKDLSKDMSPQAISKLIADMPKDGRQIFEATHFTKDGRAIPVEISSSLVTYQGKQAVLSIARDITERKKAEDAIKEANLLLKQSNSELESYTYVVSHDLKAPLRTIKSFGSFLLEDYQAKFDETGQDYLNRMVNASSRLDTMIEDLLVLSRVGRKFTEYETVNLNKLLVEILTDLEATIKETKTKVVVDKLPVLLAQRVWMRQLFMNLISNALKFNESKNPKIEVIYEDTPTEHQFKVQDNGIGIEEKYLNRIFNLFERAPTEKKYEGTGAGLSICKKIVEHLGGKIWVESTLGKGSVFFFTIPKEIKKEKEKKT